jgi:hypothetical protein
MSTHTHSGAHVFNPEAYADGLAAGKSDRRIGVRSDYAWYGLALDPVYSYSWHYSRGYHDAWGA